MKKAILLAIVCFLTFANSPLALAQDERKNSTISYTPKSIETMFNESEGVIVGKLTFDGRETENPPVLRYRSLEYIKGLKLSAGYPIKFSQHDEIPKENSKWILFIKELVPCDGAFETINGSEGRVKYTSENYDEVLKAVANAKKKLNAQSTKGKVTPALIEKMFKASEKIFVAEYKRYEADGQISKANPPIAIYRTTKYLKGAKMGVAPRIHYQFPETSPANKWQFKESMMPAKNSKWILFIPNAIPVDGSFETYEGAAGRVPYTEKNMDMLLKVLEKYKGERQSSKNKKSNWIPLSMMERWKNMPTKDPVIMLGIDIPWMMPDRSED